ncbi:MAG: hypothetical protein COA84_14015 [Robiginitomaculum sp.]|nr:MAG: hypothetical protein COA84_14015 [Robiginitomaculum sp.]
MLTENDFNTQYTSSFTSQQSHDLSKVPIKDLMNECVRRGAIKELTFNSSIPAHREVTEPDQLIDIQRQMASDLITAAFDGNSSDIFSYTWAKDMAAMHMIVNCSLYLCLHPTQIDNVFGK